MSTPTLGTSTPTITAAICCYTEQRWGELCRAIDSALAPAHSGTAPLLVVVDHNEALQARLQRTFADEHENGQMVVLSNTHQQGLSGARNTALGAAASDLVAFLDDDATAPAGWAAALASEFRDPSVVAVGGGANPVWPDNRHPAWFPDEFGWVVGCSYIGMPTEPAFVRNVIGCNMAVRRTAALAAGGFGVGLGRVGANVAGCEETELCIRMAQNAAAQTTGVRFLPDLRVDHVVTPERATLRYFLRRCYGEGRSKAAVVDAVGNDGTSAERRHVLVVLPRGVLAGLAAVFRGDLGGPMRALAIVVGTAATVAGYLGARASR